MFILFCFSGRLEGSEQLETQRKGMSMSQSGTGVPVYLATTLHQYKQTNNAKIIRG